MTSAPASAAPSMGRRQYLLAVVMIALAALLSWWALSRPWVSYTESLLGVGADEDAAFAAATALVQTTGASLLPLAAAMPILLLAGIAGVVGTRGVGRRVVGVVVVVVGLVMAASIAQAAFVTGLESFVPDSATEVGTDPVYALLAVAAGVLGLAGGLLVLLRGAAWPALGRSYERATSTPRDDWEALDRGLDPTLDPQTDSPADSPEPRRDTPDAS